jgi:sulfur-oxidizing protein SoxY
MNATNDMRAQRASADGCPARRQVIAGAIAVAVSPLVLDGSEALAAAGQLDTAIATLTGGAPVTEGRVKLTMPALAENGFSVTLTVAVDSPMTAADHVASIHVLSEKNPVADVVAFKLGPRAGRARVSTSVRLADSQRIVALAQMSDGSFWTGSAAVIVTISACIDGG